MRCESCSAPPSKRRSGPRSLVAKNGDSGSPQRIQNNAASNDVGALLRANTPSIAVLARASPPSTQHACTTSHAT